MKICVVGIGYVGLVSAACLAEAGNNVICVDSDKNKVAKLRKGQIPIYEYGLTELVQHNEKSGRLEFTTDLKHGVENSLIIFLAVGTPSAADGSADISAVLAVAGDIAEAMSDYRIIVTKSTVPVGTYKKVTELIKSKTDLPFDYVSNPEFLKEGAAVDDFMSPDRIIVGTTNPAVMEIMKQLYSPFMRRSNRMLCMDPASAEMTKYAANAMLATKISFINEISTLCEVLGADVEQVRQGIGSDSRIGPAFIFPGIGYGGSCFPKDVRALIHMGKANSIEMKLMQSVEQRNILQQQRFAQRIIDHFEGTHEEVTLAAWGLAFKARTDDVRESAAIYCIKKLLDAGIKINAYDPEAMPAAQEELDGRINAFQNGYDCLDNCNGLVILTDWQEFRNPDFERIAKALKRTLIFDGRNLYEPTFVKKAGFQYYSIGRP
ncbi:MAG: UDP-glucose/GDP-mannose dehydrogenase family protein [Planctomycetota bacterium]